MNPAISLVDAVATLTIPICAVVFCIGCRIIYLARLRKRMKNRIHIEKL